MRFCCWYMSSSRAAFSGGLCRCNCTISCCCLSTFSSSVRSRQWWCLALLSPRASRPLGVDGPPPAAAPRGGASGPQSVAAAVRRPRSSWWSWRWWAASWCRSDSWRWQARTCRWSSRSRSSSSVSATDDLAAMTSPYVHLTSPD